MDATEMALTCECRRDMEKKLAEWYAASCNGASNVVAELQGYGFSVTDELGVVSSACMEVKYTADWAQKTGTVRRKSYKGKMFFSYCPFCGRKAGAPTPSTYVFDIQSIKYLAGEVTLKTIVDVPESLESGMRVTLQKVSA